MSVHVEVSDHSGFRSVVVDRSSFWIGARKSNSDVELDLPGCAGRALEVRAEAGQVRLRVEAGLPFPVRSSTGSVGTRFEPMLEGDVLNVGPALIKLRALGGDDPRGEELDPGALVESGAPGAPIGDWYQTFMEVADNLEGITAPERMVDTALSAVLTVSGAERVMVELDAEHGIDGRTAFFLSRGDERTPFRVSRTLVDQVQASGHVVHVPVSSKDPVASRFVSVRREGISSTIALPLRALGKTLGVLYADCVREGQMLSVPDLQRVAFIARLLASALGNRALVSSLAKDLQARAAAHPALQTASPAYAEAAERVKMYSPTDYTVLIRGETGTGKEIVAHAIHELSRRRKGPFVPVNCAAIPEQLMESMLFGHEKGAFTGATQARAGHFEEAHGGTLFLDEIGDMALDLQSKILRVLQDRIVVPVGGRRQIKVDVRILAATHQDLERMVQEGRFREDLYYRLHELEIALPPLRERRADIVLLAQRFLHEASQELGYPRVPEIAEPALQVLQHAEWRGNIRELRHCIKGAALRAGGRTIRAEHLEAAVRPRVTPAAANAAVDESLTWKERLEAQEKDALRETLQRSNGNLTRGAELFGVPRTTYRERLVKHGLLKSSEAGEG
jgi:transcriptional regulator with GAF, ATPase, and Fis domain